MENKKKRTDTARQRSVRFELWIHEYIENLAAEKHTDFTDIVNTLLQSELEFLGYSKADYDAKRLNLSRPVIESETEERQVDTRKKAKGA